MKAKSNALKGTTPLDHAKGQILNQIMALAEQSMDEAKQGWVTPFESGEIMTNGEAKRSSSTIAKSINSLAVQWGGDEGFDVDAEIQE